VFALKEELPKAVLAFVSGLAVVDFSVFDPIQAAAVVT
jgi:hypothetical protein